MSICEFCSDEYNFISHFGKCPKVKSIEYYRNGTIKKVEFIDPYNNIQKMNFTMIDKEIYHIVDDIPPSFRPI